MKPETDDKFKHDYQSHLKYLKLRGLQPKTIDYRSQVVSEIGFNSALGNHCKPIKQLIPGFVTTHHGVNSDPTYSQCKRAIGWRAEERRWDRRRPGRD